MSRSVKKNPVIKENCRGSNKKNKKIANHKIRAKLKKEDYIVANGNAYQKEYDSWRISDYKFSKTEVEALEEYRRASDPSDTKYDPFLLKYYPTENDFMRWWRRHYKNK